MVVAETARFSSADPHAIDGAAGGPHAARDGAAFESRPCRGRAGHQEIPVAEHHLPVGADVQQQGDFLRLVHSGSQNSRGDVAADVASGHGEGVQDAARVDPQPDLGRTERRRAGRRRHKRRDPDQIGFQSQQEVQHGRIAGSHHARDIAPADLCPVGQVLDERFDVLDNGLVQGLGAARLPRVVDAADNVGAELDLGVVLGGGVAGSARRKVNQVSDDRRGAHVEGKAEIVAGRVARLDTEHLAQVAAETDRGRDAAVPPPVPRGSAHRAAAQHARQLPRDLQAHLHGTGSALGDRFQKPLLVGRGIVEGGLGQLQGELFHQRIQLHGWRLRSPIGEVPKLLVIPPQAFISTQPRLRRHLDHQVAPRHNLAGQHVAAEDFVAGQKIRGLSFDLAFADDYPALAADSFSRADSARVNVGAARSLQQRGAVVDHDLSVVRQEANAKVCHVNYFGFHCFLR